MSESCEEGVLVPTLRKGVLIAFEGIDGSGKTTQAHALKATLRSQGYDAIYLKEPTGGQHGQQIRHLATHGRHDHRLETQLFLKDRTEDVQQNICPALDSRKVVIMDRYYFSNMCYQGALGESTAAIKKANEKFAPIPDLVILLDVSPRVGISRIMKRGDKANHFEEEGYLKKVRQLFGRLDEAYIQRIDAASSTQGVEEAVLNVVLPVLRRHEANGRADTGRPVSAVRRT